MLLFSVATGERLAETSSSIFFVVVVVLAMIRHARKLAIARSTGTCMNNHLGHGTTKSGLLLLDPKPPLQHDLKFHEIIVSSFLKRNNKSSPAIEMIKMTLRQVR